jgi:flagellar hook assembly protein FlgD
VEEYSNDDVFDTPIQISPNPFRKVLAIRWSNTDVYEDVTIKIYDISGQLVKTLNNPVVNYAIWDGTDNTGGPLPAGVYFCNIRMAERRYTAKVVKID